MNSKFMMQINDKKLVELISGVQEQLILSLPGIHHSLATLLTNIKARNVKISIVVNVSEDNIRQGFGSLSAIRRLKEKELNILHFPNSHISFIIIDKIGYFIFPKSKMFSEFNDGVNAIQMDSLMLNKILRYFIPGENLPEIDKQKILEDAELSIIKLSADNEKAPLKVIEDIQLEEIEKKLQENPPINPDFQRIVSIYSTKFQFVELNFQGANIHIKKVDIPRNALPIKDKVLRKNLESKLRIFTNLPENEGFNKFFEFKNKIDEIRDQYLTYLPSHKKRIIKKKDKQKFLSEIDNQIKQIEKLKQYMKSLIQKEILKSKKTIKQELLAFFAANPPENYPDYDDNFLFEEWNKDNVFQIVAKIKYPKPDELLNSLSIICHFYDITYGDLRDNNFIEELRELNIITQKENDELVEFSKGYLEKE